MILGGEGWRSLSTKRLHKSAQSCHNHTLSEQRRSTQNICPLHAPNPEQAESRLWHLCHQPGKLDQIYGLIPFFSLII